MVVTFKECFSFYEDFFLTFKWVSPNNRCITYVKKTQVTNKYYVLQFDASIRNIFQKVYVILVS